MWVNTNAFDESEPFFFLLASFSTKIFEVFKGLSFFFLAGGGCAIVARPAATTDAVAGAVRFFFPFCHHHQLFHTVLAVAVAAIVVAFLFLFLFSFWEGVRCRRFFFCRSLFGLSVAFCAFDGNAKKGKKKRHGKGEASRSDREPRKPVLLLLLLFLFFLVSSSPFGFFFSLVVARVRPRKREGGALNEKGGE